MKLQKKQREAVLSWIAEGLESDEINKRAATFKPRFKATRQQVDHYRKTRKVDLGELQHSGEMTALTSGLAKRVERVALLQKLAERMTDDLLGKESRMWLAQVKGIGSAENYERVEYQEFNTAEVTQLRGVLDDIASELGQRAPNVQIENNFFSMDDWKKQRADRLNQVRTLDE